MYFFPQEKKLALTVYFEKLTVHLWECYCLLQQNINGISAQIEKGKGAHYLKNYFTVSPKNRWKLMTRESSAYLII